MLRRLVVLVLALLAGSAASASAQTYGVAVSPQGATTPNRTTHTTGHTAVFTVINEGTAAQNFAFTCVGASNVTCTNVNPASYNLPGDQQVQVTATYSVGNEGSGQVYLTATGPQSADQGWWNVPVVLPAGAPKVSVLPYLEAKQDYGRCAASCFAATYAQSTVPCFSLDAPRNVTLVYHGDRVAPKPFVLVDVRPDSSFGSWPSEYQLQVKVNSVLVTFVNGETTLRFGNPANSNYRIGGQFAATGYTHGTVYPMEILATAKIGASYYTNRWITQYLHIDEAKSKIARGWTLAGIQRAFIVANTGILVTEGDGSATYFKYNTVTLKYEAPTGDFSTVATSGSNWVRAYPDSTKVTFNSAGEMVKVADRWGVRDTVIYTSGKVTQIKDHLNNTITLAYGTYGLSSITDPTSRVTAVSVASDTTLSWIQDPDNLKTTFGYDGWRRVLSITARNNKTTTLAYDSQSGKVITVTGPSVQIFGGSSVQPVTTLAAWQKLGVPYGATSGTPFPPVKADTAYARVTEPGGARTRFSVNRWGSPVRSIGPFVADTTTVAHTLAGLPARIRKPGYGATDFDTLAYNGSGLVTYAKPAQATYTQATYGAYAQPTTVVSQFRDSVTYFRGSLGRLDSVRVGSVTVARYASYDVYGRPLVVRRPSFDTTTYAYYTTGTHKNLNTVTLSGGRTTTYKYDTKGRPTYLAYPDFPRDSIDYGTMNQVTARRQKAGVGLISTLFQYDSLFNVTQVTDPKSQTYKYRYNALGWLIRQEDPAAKRDTVEYSIDGELRRHKTRRDLTIDFTYDSLHRVRSRTGTVVDSFYYGLNGRRIVGKSLVARDSIFLNVRGQADSAVTRMAGQRYLRRYHYTSSALQDSLYASGGVSLTTRGYGYDLTKGLLTAIKLGTAQTSITRDAGLQDSAIVLPGGGGSMLRTFGSLHAPVKITSTAQPGATERWIGFDLLGRITEHLDYGGTGGRFFVYDSLGRYQKAADSVATGSPPPGCPDPVNGSLLCNNGLVWDSIPGTTRLDTLDIVGNRKSTGGTYAPGTNRITAFNGCTYVTDAAGSDSVRTCGGTVTNFTWNKEGQLTGLAVTGQPTVTFDYDAFGRLVKKTAGGTAAYFLWDGDNLLAELGSTGTSVTAEYSYYPGLDRLHAMIVSGTRYYGHRDGLGNVIALTDESGVLKRTFDFDDWGQLTGSTDPGGFGNKDRARWKGALWMGPETEIYYMRNRWYEPRTGRFISEDPTGLAGGINPLVFEGSDPVNGRDPMGLGCLFVYRVTSTYLPGSSMPSEIAVTFLGEVCDGGGGGFSGGIPRSGFPRGPGGGGFPLGGGGGGGLQGAGAAPLPRSPPPPVAACMGVGAAAAMWNTRVGPYTVLEDAGRAGGLGTHYQVYTGGQRLPGIILPDGRVLRHAGKDPAIPGKVLKHLRRLGKIPGVVSVIVGLFLIEPLMDEAEALCGVP